jgi:hypothetical protein
MLEFWAVLLHVVYPLSNTVLGSRITLIGLRREVVLCHGEAGNCRSGSNYSGEFIDCGLTTKGGNAPMNGSKLGYIQTFGCVKNNSAELTAEALPYALSILNTAMYVPGAQLYVKKNKDLHFHPSHPVCPGLIIGLSDVHNSTIAIYWMTPPGT